MKLSIEIKETLDKRAKEIVNEVKDTITDELGTISFDEEDDNIETLEKASVYLTKKVKSLM